VFRGFLNGRWNSLTLKRQTENNLFEVSDLSGKVEDFPLSLGPNGNIEDIINNTSLRKGRLFYSDSVVTAVISNISGTGKEGVVELNGIEIKPKATLQPFFKTSAWQKDYLTFNCDRIVLNKINSHALLQDRALNIQHVSLQNPRLSTHRDMNIAFQHGIEKVMPTKLISGIRIPIHVDSVSIQGASIDVHEVSPITKREGIVPLRNVEALCKNFTNRPNEKDSLQIDVVGRVLNYDIKKFRYSESYHDSLSGFKMNYSISPMALPAISEVTNPLSAMAVTSGQADTLYAKLSGNKYAAFGEMNFYYHDLRIRLLNKEDTLKKSLTLAFATVLANGLIKSKNKECSQMFYIRDRERFVFNYWIKTLFSGLLTSVGVKSNAKYEKRLTRLAGKYSLPASNDE
jgi:hypothetical protein